MGYSCPVCADPQADGIHLANHLAITAMTRGGDHEAFLDDHVPDWTELGEEELAESLRDAAEETEYPQVFEDTTGNDHSHDHEHGGSGTRHAGRPAESVPFEMDQPDELGGEETDEIMEEAMELTRQRRAQADDSDEPETE
ncbi:MAG: hypothetical protein ACI8TL_001927 [Natronomonas sp.]|jgi:hypothetical protein